MGGKNKKRKHALFHASREAQQRVQPDINPISADNDDGLSATDSDAVEISAADLRITVRTLQKLSEKPMLLASPAYRDLRLALNPIILQRLQSYETPDYRTTVTAAVKNGEWVGALAALKGCLDCQQTPKPGTVQRWVRDCDATADAVTKMKLLTAILRVAGSSSTGNTSMDFDSSAGGASVSATGNKHGIGKVLVEQLSTIRSSESSGQDSELVILEGWRIPSDNKVDSAAIVDASDAKTYSPEIDAPAAAGTQIESRIIYSEEAANRTPPNKYDLRLHVTAPDTIKWNTTPGTTVKHAVPFAPGALVLENVLSASECKQLLTVSSQLGFRPDHPITLDRPTGIDSCEWLVDRSITDIINERVKEHLPPQFMSGGQTRHLYSINPRWRFFRYEQDAVYRLHMDGSWPESRINDEGEYEFDKSGAVTSYLTFLIYLNDDFTGGETRFYFPDVAGAGLTARGVVPRAGSVLVFPQANTAALIHEGSAVESGTKYVIRSDVLYRAATT
jgi:hypothetical protein